MSTRVVCHGCGVPFSDLEMRWAQMESDRQEREYNLEQDLATESKLAAALDCPWCGSPLRVSCECRERNPAAIEIVETEAIDMAVMEAWR